MVHKLGTHRSAFRSGFPRHAICIAEHLGGKQAQSSAHISSHLGTHVGIPCSLSPGDLPAMTVYVHTAGRCCLQRATVRVDLPIC